MSTTAIAFDSYGGPEVLHPVEVEIPAPGAGRIAVRVRAAGVNPFDAKVRAGLLREAMRIELPHVLGSEYSGVVEAVGPGVDGPRAGDEVLGFCPSGAYAELLTAPADQATAKPPGLGWEVAAGLSTAGQAAYTFLKQIGVGPGDTVLVHAAAGGVGSIAVQLARIWGAEAIGTAAERNHDYLRSLGAIPLTYGDGLLERVREAAPGGVDASLVAVGGEALDVSLAVVEDRSRIASTVGPGDSGSEGIVTRPEIARSAAILTELAGLVESGRLEVALERAFGLAEAPEAHRTVEAGHVRGKVVLVPTA